MRDYNWHMDVLVPNRGSLVFRIVYVMLFGDESPCNYLGIYKFPSVNGGWT